MEERGLIKRIADTKNNIIIKRNEVTQQGQKIFKKGNAEFLKIKDKIYQEFSEEDLKHFIKYLKKYREIISTIVDVKLK